MMEFNGVTMLQNMGLYHYFEVTPTQGRPYVGVTSKYNHLLYWIKIVLKKTCVPLI